MNSLDQQQRQTEMWPPLGSDQATSVYRNGSRGTSDAEDLMAYNARKKIQVRLKMAKLFQHYRANLPPNKYGVSVSSDPPSTDEKICLTLYENRKVVSFTVKNSGVREVSLTIWVSNLVKNIFTFKDSHGNKLKTMRRFHLRPGEAYKLKVHFYSPHGGFYEQLLVFQFETQQHRFEVMRLFEIIHRTSFSEEPPSAAANSLCDVIGDIWTPAKCPPNVWLRTVVFLKRYPVPTDIHDINKQESKLEKMSLNWKTYCEKFHLLLHLEEHQQETEAKKFNQRGRLFKHQGNPNILMLKNADTTQGAALNLVRNPVLVTHEEFLKRNVYKAWVQHVDAEHIYMQFDDECLRTFKNGSRFKFDFILNRLPLRVQHRAADLARNQNLEEVLFPTGQFSSQHSELHSMTELDNNPEQRKAVQHIVAATAKPAPYLVFGPPGTGKTMTLVEAISQILKTQPKSRILACAPSNNATDHLCEKILDKKICKVFRMYALSFPVKNIPEKIKDSCNLHRKTKGLWIPSKRTLMKYRILITSLQTSGRLVSGAIPLGFYNYIFVDEAGQAPETECIIPIAGLVNQFRCQVVLAGDPKQLGPLITSPLAVRHGLDVSLLERLMNNIDLYKPHETEGYDNRFVTILLRNYRSHPAILKVPNELFYHGQLQPFADREACTFFYEWEYLPNKSFPLIFHGVAGTDEREGSCPSIYNMAEVEVLKEYLKALLCYFKKKGVSTVRTRDIGIIAPYRKQVEKIQKALQTDKDLKTQDLKNILIGSVEQFQGKEFNAILVSTVRSGPKLTASKQRFTLGFVDDAKRFNVAVTRARGLLVVVGDPRALQTDYNWNKFIHYCFQEGGYRGIAVSDPKEEEDEDEAQGLWC